MILKTNKKHISRITLAKQEKDRQGKMKSQFVEEQIQKANRHVKMLRLISGLEKCKLK